MTTLGALLVRLRDREELAQILAESGDVFTLCGLDRVAADSGKEVCDAALEAVESFTTSADDEAWVKLIGRLQNSPQPAGACLSQIISWSLER